MWSEKIKFQLQVIKKKIKISPKQSGLKLRPKSIILCKPCIFYLSGSFFRLLAFLHSDPSSQKSVEYQCSLGHYIIKYRNSNES